jgi:hypothetical protein
LAQRDFAHKQELRDAIFIKDFFTQSNRIKRGRAGVRTTKVVRGAEGISIIEMVLFKKFTSY